MRKAGIGAIKNKNLAQARYRDKGTELASEQLSMLSKQLDNFKGNLEEFAAKHKNEIKGNSRFRVQFQEMCASIGVDPLASGKGFWSEMLGVGDFYYELGVQIVEVCLSTNHRNGGLMSLEELHKRVIKSRGKVAGQDITQADLLMAIKKLKALGNGFTLIPATGGRYLVQSVPGELSMDHTTVLQQAESDGFITTAALKTKLGWEQERAQRALDDMLKEGLAWIDSQAKPHKQYWFPGLFAGAMTAT